MTVLLSRRALLGVLAVVGVSPEARAAVATPADEIAALNAVLAIEHAVIYDLAVAGAQLGIAARREIRERYDEHRVHRDRLEDEVTRLGGRPAVTEPAYRLPGPVGGKSTMATIELVERAAASAYHVAIGALQDQQTRTVCVESFLDEARHLALTRLATGDPLAAAAQPFVTGA
jgi:demethoxyubiquinone hydroxylase (CLK1/Coq7/Cat5 family)